MDYQFWLYVIIGVIYLISRLIKKPENTSDFPEYGPEKPVKNPKAQPRSDDSSETSLPKQLTFEELLREITEGKAQPKEHAKPVTTSRKYSYEDEVDEEIIANEKRKLENVDHSYKESEVVAAYEEAKRQAFLRPSLEETMDIRTTDVTFGRFKEFEKDTQRNLLQEYLGNINDSNGWKKAVVMSEILQRKF